MIEQSERLRALVETGIALASELSLDGVLQQIVESAARLTGSRYAALGVIDASGRGLEHFVFAGLSEEEAREIGDHPVGRGILGVLIRDAAPLRLHDLTEDPRSVGFPPGHPPMRTFLGVPIVLRGVPYGNLYLTEKGTGEDFTDEDEDLLKLLAAQAAVAIENARLYGSATRWMRQLESMTEIGNALASETDLHRLLDLIADRLRALLEARFVFIALERDGALRIEAAADHVGIASLAGLELPRSTTKAGRVLERGRPERVGALLDDPEINQEVARSFAKLTSLPAPTAGIFVPLVVHGRAIGVIAAHDKLSGGHDLRFSEEDLRLAEIFASRAAVAVDLSQRIRRDALRHVMEAQEQERKRLARELHDETGQALTSILLGLRAVEGAATDEERAAALDGLREIVVATLRDVRRLAVELRPKALDDFGLTAAIERLAQGFSEQTGIDVQLELHVDGRLSREVESTLYRIVQEALTNVMKHARARAVSIVAARTEGGVALVVEDDGIGFDPERVQADHLGLAGMGERLALVHGRLTVESSPGAGATVAVQVPLP